MAETKRTGIIDKEWGNILANVVESTATPWTYGLVALNPDWSDIGWPASAIVIWNPVVGWNPWRILYIDQSGNLFGDDAAVRDSGVQKQTTIGSGTYAQASANDWVSAEVYFQADVIGDTGNSISLVFDGIDDADTVLNAWNTANPWNTASIIDWVGTTVPTAGTMIFIGWWEIIYESGTVNNGVSTFFQGSGSTLLDNTNGKIWFSTTGNLISVIWEPSLWFAAAGIDFNTGNLWAMFVSDIGINFFVTDQSTYNARLQGDDVEIILDYNGTYLWVNGLSWPLWWDSSSNRYILPTNVTPSVGDTLAVAGISGNDYALDFVAWWVTIGDAISGGSANQILFGDASTNVAQSPDLFFDATQKIFRVWDVSWTSNWVTFVLDDTIPAIKSMFADGIGTFEISWTGGNRLFLATASNWSFQAWDVDLVSWGALLLVNSSFWEVKNVWDYYRFSPIGALFDYLFEINSSAKTTKIWDVAGIANSTLLTVDDTNKIINLSAVDPWNLNSRIFVSDAWVWFEIQSTGADVIQLNASWSLAALSAADWATGNTGLIRAGLGTTLVTAIDGNTLAAWSFASSTSQAVVSFSDASFIVNWLIVNATNLRIGNYDWSWNGTLITVDDTNTKITVNNRFETDKGADVTAANNLTLGWDWNLFVITGNTQINAITTANWQAGSMITLIFTWTPTVKHNTAWWAGTAVLFLAGSLDLVAANNTVLGLIYDGTQRQETFRKVA